MYISELGQARVFSGSASLNLVSFQKVELKLFSSLSSQFRKLCSTQLEWAHCKCARFSSKSF